MFADPRFHKVANGNWLYAGLVDGVRVGVISATYNSTFGNYSLNCNEFKRAIDAKSSDRVAAVYVIKTRYDTRTSQRRVIEVIEASGVGRDASQRGAPRGKAWGFLGFERL